MRREVRPASGQPDVSLVKLRPRADTLYVSSGRTVLATDRDGFIDDGPDMGLFVHETRLLSTYRYRIEDRALHPVAASNVSQRSWLGYYIAPAPLREDASCFAATAAANIYKAAQQTVELRLSRFVGEGMHEDVDVSNFTQEPVRFRLLLEIGSDFADQAETHDERRQRGRVASHWTPGERSWELRADYEVTHSYSHQGEVGVARLRRGLATRFSNAGSPPVWKDGVVAFDIVLEPQGAWHCCVDHAPIIENERMSPRYGCRSFASQDNDYDRRSRIFLDESTRFASAESDALSGVVVGALEQGKRDLAALRLFDLDCNDRAWITAAGLPLYVALFGRDTLTAAWEAAPLGPELMQGTLPVLVDWQGRASNPWRDEEPGRMLHEAHSGPLAALNYIPQGRNYGSVTTSGFFPFVVAQLWHWTADKALVRPYLEPALAALEWLDKRCDTDRDGFCAYHTKSEQGVENQGWKDSGDAIVYEDGSQTRPPIATCEEQGIVYSAKANLAEVLWWMGRKDEAKRLLHEASELKKRFNEAFWMEDEGFFAMALDSDRRQVRSIGSNALHCVATGIADKALVPRTMRRLFAPDMFTGWGVRTLSAAHPAYNPYAYHRGTVWPVEHGPFAVGAYRYGLHDDVERICRGQFEAAAFFEHHRLPECFAGHQRDDDHPFPAPYPAANSPQAWSATTVYTLLQAMLGLQPYAPLRVLFVDPFLPAWLPEITISGLRVANATISIRFRRKRSGRTDYEILSQRGLLFVVRQPSYWSMTAGLGERIGDAASSLFH
ncbi:MAG TPA: glycogen debranching N-terminal domain-containing protein [Vitreimonas sp.]|uniref:amylo-alpha-1,6-glucosidase n=1 Tax=Vitreimonas sp. TaxID=3069702 RepID=UPI002D66DE84|nr:glycogen debranching N-terminal domain-containing protein [Vitreimonas sp.]HYD86557.1 glycogen debranching N-terminal domain-containing protein [Vitreimonas sp.]